MYSVMLILFGLMICGCPILIYLSPNEKKHNADEIRTRNRRMMIFAGVLFSIVAIVGGFLLGSVIVQRNEITENCIAIDIPASDKILFYDGAEQEYFFTKNSDWDLKTMVVRDVIDYETGKTIHENTNQMRDALENIKDKLQ